MQVPKGHPLLLMKSMYGTRQPASQCHQRISGWMESHDYMAVNNEKTMFLKWKGSDLIIYGLFVDDMARASTSQKMIKRGDFMTSFLGLDSLEVERDKRQIRLHLDTYANEMIEEYKAYIKRDLKPKKI